MDQDKKATESHFSCVTRRKFLLGSGAVVATTVLLPPIAGLGGQALAAELAAYPRKRIGLLSDLKLNKPEIFTYPGDNFHSRSMLVKMGVEAGGGIGDAFDVVAYNCLCTHMGGELSSFYQPDHQVVGPCVFHQSVFDLTRHGIIVNGHATESLPQVLLELDGDVIYATGLIGLIYGHFDNLKV